MPACVQVEQRIVIGKNGCGSREIRRNPRVCSLLIAQLDQLLVDGCLEKHEGHEELKHQCPYKNRRCATREDGCGCTLAKIAMVECRLEHVRNVLYFGQ